MTAQQSSEEKFLPKERLDLPKPQLDLPESESEEENVDSSEYDVVTLLSWHAPGRPFQKRGKAYYMNILILTFLVEIVLFLFGQYMFMLVVASLAFAAIALTIVPPQDFRYRISTEGLTVEDHSYIWDELYDFYFKIEHAQPILHVRTKAYFPGELIITLGNIHKDQVKGILVQYLPYRESVAPTSLEKAGNWLSTTFPLEK